MSQALATTDSALLALLAGAGGPLPLPFGREILLLECRLAGTSHLDLAAAEPALEPGQRLTLRREPANLHDPLAVRVDDRAGTKLGYLPRDRNEVIARLLDAGKQVEAILRAKHWSTRCEGWLKLDVAVLLVEV